MAKYLSRDEIGRGRGVFLLVGGGGTWIVMALRQGEISQ
ncbi:MAG: hypothetical protein ACI97A_004219, partial [Planctomycetota bacterium]